MQSIYVDNSPSSVGCDSNLIRSSKNKSVANMGIIFTGTTATSSLKLSSVASSVNVKDSTSTIYLAGCANDGPNGRYGFVVARGIAPVHNALAPIVISSEDITDPILD